jgi:UDP-N-acetylmuramate dehydrogenase
VVSADLSLLPGDRSLSEAAMADIVAWRRANQPGGANAGSVFTNPPGDSAGRLIDAAGGKGLRIGTAEVSTKHANFIQVDPGGSANDVAAVMEAVVALVRDATGVELVPDTRMVGFAGTLGGPARTGVGEGNS